ncbi:MAG: hypothetical protein EXS39_00890 [Opitutaceae bacterium]|nr:hypothetical protein [Opitutaceae bacterium]
MKRRIFVQVWCEIDPTLNLRIDRQTAVPVAGDGDELMRVSPIGRFGISEALRLGDSEVTAFAVGGGHEGALGHALAAGASRAVQLRFEGPLTDDAVVAGLASWLAGQSPELVIAGPHAGRTAARLGWAHLAGLDGLEINGKMLSALRQFGRGASEKVSARIPAIVRLRTDAPRLRYVARARMVQAGRHAINVELVKLPPATPPALELGPLQLLRPRTRLGAAPAVVSAKAADRLNALMGLAGRSPGKPIIRSPESAAKTTDEMAEEFVRYLAHHDLLRAPE